MDQHTCRCGNALKGRQRYCSTKCKQKSYRIRQRGRRTPDAEPFRPECVPLDSQRVYPPPRRHANQAVRRRRGSTLRTRDEIAVRESLRPGVPSRHDTRQPPDPFELDGYEQWLSPEEQWLDICREAHKGDLSGVKNLLAYYNRTADHWLKRKIMLALYLLSPYRWAWNEALRESVNGTREEQLWVGRTVMMNHGIENFMRATGIEPDRLSRFMGDGTSGASRATIYRIHDKIKKEERMNATAINEIKMHVDQRFDRLERLESMRAETMDRVRETVEDLATRFPGDQRIEETVEDFLAKLPAGDSA
jgi:hypothetical protein